MHIMYMHIPFCGRRRVLELTEAVLASVLMALLLLAVLGMPIGALSVHLRCLCYQNSDMSGTLLPMNAGAIYLVLKAAAYFIRALLSLPVISGLLVPLQKSVAA